MRIGLGSYALRWAVGTETWQPATPVDPRALIDRAAALGAEVLQICDNVPLDACADRALAGLAQRAAGQGLALQLGVRGSELAYLRRSLAIAERIEARLLRVVLDEGGRTPAVAKSAAVLRALLPDLRAAGIALAIENHFSLSPAALAQLVTAIDDPLVGVCLDPLNPIARLTGVAETVRTLAPYAIAVHAKDAVARRMGTGFAIVGCPLGEGLVDVAGLLDAVRSTGRSPDILVESWMDRLADEAATLAQEEAWARHGIAYLRRLLDEPQPHSAVTETPSCAALRSSRSIPSAVEEQRVSATTPPAHCHCEPRALCGAKQSPPAQREPRPPSADDSLPPNQSLQPSAEPNVPSADRSCTHARCPHPHTGRPR